MKRLSVFVPLFILYCIIILITRPSESVGDEGRYLMYANNLIHGHYAPEGTNYLWNGPGYPLLLTPFVATGIPLLFAKLLNAFFLFLAVAYFYKTLCIYISKRNACIWGYLFGLYLPFMRNLPYLLTETYSIFLVAALIYHVSRFTRENRFVHFWIASAFAGILALTKIFFGYVLICMLACYTILYLIRRKRIFLYYAGIYLTALVICLPYLTYTAHLTGKLFYWGNAGGISLYWMSSPHANDLGDWHSLEDLDKNHQLSTHHRDFLENIQLLSWVEKDTILKKAALRNIRQHPAKFLKNWFANVGRLLFNYPYSYTPQKLSTIFYILPNMFLISLICFSFYPAWLNRRRIPIELHHYLLFATIAFFGSSLLSAYNRQFMVLIPFLLTRSVIVVQRYVIIKK